jgi:phosphatidylinositol alpha-mannosyltransferase
MKIGFVSPYDYGHPGGVNAHITHLAAELVKMGHEVKTYAPCSKNRPHYMRQGVVPLGHVIPIPHNGSIAYVTLSSWLIPKVRRILSREKYDVLHFHEPSCPLLPWLFLAFSKSVNVATFHYYGERSMRYWLGVRTPLRVLPRKLDGRTAVSQFAMECALRYLPGEYRLIPNGIDPNYFSADSVAPMEQYCDGKTNILFVGRLEKRKGADYLIRAYDIVKRERPESRLIIVGAGDKRRRKYEKEIAERRLQDIVFTGYVSDEELTRYYRTADIFCAPATGKESFGIVLLEAMAAGKPVVASDIGGYSRVVDHDVDGLLVPPKDEDRLAEGILGLIGNPSLRETMGAKGKEKAQRYSWGGIAQQTLDYYLELMARKRNNGRTP